MRLSRLRLSNFRNLVEVDLEVPPGVSVYFGQNAQGKTALAEAVYILAIARSFRAENERELVNFAAARDGGQALVDGLVDDPDDAAARQRVIVGYRAFPSNAAGGPGYRVSKQIRVNRLRRTAGSLVGLVHAVLFSVQDIELVQGPPSARRRFLDILISQADPAYLQGLQRYRKVLQQRNRLLRMRREGRARPDEMEFWDDELVREGAWLTWRRREIMNVLTPACIRHHRDLIGAGETLELRYRPSVPLPEDPAPMESGGMAGAYRDALRMAAGRERATAATAAGPPPRRLRHHRKRRRHGRLRLPRAGPHAGPGPAAGRGRDAGVGSGRRAAAAAGRRPLRDGRRPPPPRPGEGRPIPASAHHHHRR